MGAEAWSVTEWKQRLADVSGSSGVSLGEDAVDRLARFASFLVGESEKLNLVSRRLDAEALLRDHILESLLGLPHVPPRRPAGLRLLDVGSGGGFPAVPILVARPDLEGVLVESTGKKCRFLRECVSRLGLTASVAEARFPASFEMPRHPSFDILTTRAVADAGTLVRSARPWARPPLVAILWTTKELLDTARRASGCGERGFHRFPWAERRGIGLLECST